MNKLRAFLAALLFLAAGIPAALAGNFPRVATANNLSCVVILANPGSISEITVNPTAVGFMMVFDGTTCPTNGAVSRTPGPATFLTWSGQVTAANQTWNYDPPGGATFQNGIVVAYSSTAPFTLTLSSTAFFTWK